MPAVDARYWVILCIASILGANLGDAFPDLLHIQMGFGLAFLVAAFAALVALQGVLASRAEALFWVAILIVRSAATEAADLSATAGFIPAALAWAVILVAVVALSARQERQRQVSEAGSDMTIPRPGPLYWLGMFSAGTLGTIAADGFGHAISPPTIGYPLTAAGETLALIGVFCLRAGVRRAYWSYWLAVVVVRAWGTSTGDIFKYVVSLPVALGVGAAAMALAVLVWRPAPAAREGAAA